MTSKDEKKTGTTTETKERKWSRQLMRALCKTTENIAACSYESSNFHFIGASVGYMGPASYQAWAVDVKK